MFFGGSVIVDDMWPMSRLGRIIIGSRQWETDVPLIPIGIRPPSLVGYKILFEPDWAIVARTSVSYDPYLLKEVIGVYYQVVASWDVTELEINAMRAARI